MRQLFLIREKFSIIKESTRVAIQSDHSIPPVFRNEATFRLRFVIKIAVFKPGTKSLLEILVIKMRLRRGASTCGVIRRIIKIIRIKCG